MAYLKNSISLVLLGCLVAFVTCCDHGSKNTNPHEESGNRQHLPIKSTNSVLHIRELDSLSGDLPDSINLPTSITDSPEVLDSLFGFSLMCKYRHIKDEKVKYCYIHKQVFICDDRDIYTKNLKKITDSISNDRDTCYISQHYYYPHHIIIRHLDANEISIYGTELKRLSCDSLHFYKGKDEGIKFFLHFYNRMNKYGLLSCYTLPPQGKFTEFTTFNQDIIFYVPDDGFILDSYIDGKLLYKVRDNVYLVK